MPHQVRPVYEVKADLFRVLGHPARVRIIELLRDGERSVGALQAELGLDSGCDLAAPLRPASGRARRSTAGRDERLLSCGGREGVRPARRGARCRHARCAGSSRCCASSRSRDLRPARGGRRRRGRAPGGCSRIPRPRSRSGSRCRLRAAGCLAVGGFWVLGDDASGGEPFTSAFDAPRGGRPASPACSSACSAWSGRPPRSRSRSATWRRPEEGARSGRSRRCSSPSHGARPRRARPAHVPRRLGGDDARPGGGDPGRPRGRGRRAARSSSTSR